MAQLDAAENLRRFDSHESRQALIFAIEQNQYYYRVRVAAILSLVSIATKFSRTWSGAQTLIDIGQNLFSSGSCAEIVRSNDFSDFAEYFLQKVVEIIKKLCDLWWNLKKAPLISLGGFSNLTHCNYPFKSFLE